MVQASTVVGVILLTLATLGMTFGAAAFAYGSLDGEAAKQPFLENSDRVEQDQSLVVAGTSAAGMGLGLLLIGAVLLAMSSLHDVEISDRRRRIRKIVGIVLIVQALAVGIAGFGFAVAGFDGEAEQGSGFAYDENQGEGNIAMATAGSALLGFAIPTLLAGLILIAKGDKIREPPRESDGSPAFLVQNVDESRAAVPAMVEPSGVQEDNNRVALFVLAGIFGFAMIVGVVYMAIYGSGGGGGLFGEDSVYEEFMYNGSISNTGNAPLIGTIGAPWEQEFDVLERVSTLTFQVEKSVTTSFLYTVEHNVNGSWEEIVSHTVAEQMHEFTLEGEYGLETLRFRAEPNSSFVADAEIGLFIIQQS